MNNSLQSKVEEFKAKYNALQAEKAARASGSVTGSNSQQGGSSTVAVSSSTGGSSTPKPKSASSSGTNPSTEKTERSMEKLHRDYKRARKDLAAVTASKDAAKAKLEKSEKEKDFFCQMN